MGPWVPSRSQPHTTAQSVCPTYKLLRSEEIVRNGNNHQTMVCTQRVRRLLESICRWPLEFCQARFGIPTTRSALGGHHALKKGNGELEGRYSIWPRQVGLLFGMATVTTCRLTAYRFVEAGFHVLTVSMCIHQPGVSTPVFQGRRNMHLP